MPRAKGGFKTRRRRKKVLKMASGFYGARSRCYKVAKQAVEHALQDAYRDRRAKKRDFRRLWIIRINAAARQAGMTYGEFICGLKKAEIGLDRKVLAEIAYSDPNTFGELVEKAKQALAA
ncbi:MAG TPA: 50S ribosomal protein L20 [Nitrospirae bacterium]|nr:50S ribosomal protein L20 [bacterium BMS3Abin08]HDY70320.1 50S ribosomal protein L20 [Nitrospirota bacterium]